MNLIYVINTLLSLGFRHRSLHHCLAHCKLNTCLAFTHPLVEYGVTLLDLNVNVERRFNASNEMQYVSSEVTTTHLPLEV